MYCLDANVFIYYFDEDLPEHDSVRESVGDVLADEPIFTTTVLQMEVIHYLTRQLEQSEGVVERFLSLEGTTIAELTEEDVERAETLLGEFAGTGIGGRDATVLAAMERYDVGRLLTHDSGLLDVGDQTDWLSVTDPVAE